MHFNAKPLYANQQGAIHWILFTAARLNLRRSLCISDCPYSRSLHTHPPASGIDYYAVLNIKEISLNTNFRMFCLATGSWAGLAIVFRANQPTGCVRENSFDLWKTIHDPHTVGPRIDSLFSGTPVTITWTIFLCRAAANVLFMLESCTRFIRSTERGHFEFQNE